MQNDLFRKKSLERISSPEELHDYMRVTTPRLWMLLTAIIVLLAGFIVYASMANLENTMKIKVMVDNIDAIEDDNGEPVKMATSSIFFATLPISYKDTVETNMKVRIGKEEGKVDMLAIVNTDESDGQQGLSLIISMDNSSLALPDGEYDAELVLEATTPISFLWN